MLEILSRLVGICGERNSVDVSCLWPASELEKKSDICEVGEKRIGSDGEKRKELCMTVWLPRQSEWCKGSVN